MSLFWNQHHSTSADTAVATAGAAASAANSAQESARDTNERLEQLLLVSAAMWELLRERTQLTEDDLIARVAEIDARDGVADGKLTYSPVKCTQCQRTIFPKHYRCLYCGAPRPVGSVFKTI